MPDLNYTNPEVTDEMEGVARFWLEQVGVDGFRLDAARHLIEEGQNQENTEATHTWWRDFRTVYKAANPDALAVGEIWTNSYAVNDYLQGDELDMAFDFDLAKAILDNVRRYDGRAMGGDMKRSFELFPTGSYATFITNHDQERVMSTMFGAVEKATSAGSILLTGPGVPFIYYGEEIGMSGTKPDEHIRTPMQWSADASGGFTTKTPWEPVNQDYTTVNVALQTEDLSSLLSHYRTLIHLRNNHAALRVGEYVQVRCDARELLAFLRISQEETVLVLINLGGKALSEYTLSLQRSPLSGDYKGILLLGEGEVVELTVTDSGSFEDYQPVEEIPANGTVIIQLNSK
jgi:glycosidase